MVTTPTVAAIIVAAGKGVRAGGGLPKQYRSVGGKPLVARSAQVFLSHPRVAAVTVAIDPDDRQRYETALAPLLAHPKLLPWTAGGAERQDSVRAALEAIRDHEPDIVLIHDAVRPFVGAGLVSRLIEAAMADDAAGAVPALAVVDTLKRGDGNGAIRETLDRTDLWRAQTPQAFKFGAILAAHREARARLLTDDAAVAEAAGLKVVIVPGDTDNIKVTTPDDFLVAERIAGGGSEAAGARTHVGFGFDVHRFKDGDRVSLCGISVPHGRALEGHSDADVGLHALTDALLGAIGAGDIGQHFPSSDPEWRGAPSSLFLSHAVELVAQAGGRIENADITLICERPKIGPYREAMTARVAELLAIPVSRVNVKATTTEQLGFTGREEGIAAQAVATVRLE